MIIKELAIFDKREARVVGSLESQVKSAICMTEKEK